MDEMIRQLQSGPQTAAVQDQLRQVQEHKRQIQEFITRGNNITISSGVPAWVSLSLGSAYFRSGKLADAETEYKAAISADPRSGEAHSNLAVVYLETQRFNEALESINAAKKTGFKVNPELEKVNSRESKVELDVLCSSSQQLVPGFNFLYRVIAVFVYFVTVRLRSIP